MIQDLDAHTSEPIDEYDLCIVGSGPAGMTLANELSESGLRIAVLESGLLRPTARGDELRKTESKGITIKPHSRERRLGGASTTWSGLSSPFDELDLDGRPYVPDSRWPVPQAELNAAYRICAERYRFPALEMFEGGEFGALRERGDLQPNWVRLEEKVFLAAAEPQNFGREWQRVFERPGIDLWLDASVTELVGVPNSSTVDSARTKTRTGKTVDFRAKRFVLATGGLENARLLLLSRSQHDAGLGNANDQVGRYLMNHPKNYAGRIRFAKPVTDLPYYFGCMYKGYSGYAGLRLRPKSQFERELVDAYVRMEPIFAWTDSQGVEALVLFVKRSGAFFRSWKRSQRDKVVDLRDYSETGDDSELQNSRLSFWRWIGLIGIVIADLPRVLRYLYFRLSKAKPRITEARVRNFMEMEPRAENRVTLAEDLDVNGQPVARVEHECSERDRQSMLAVQEALSEDLEETGVGVLEGQLLAQDPWPIDQDASHHMGTTRMGVDPKSSVVDANLKLHGCENVWVAGASVFPTSGCANPTMTLVALSIRLARHLEGLTR